MAKQPDFDVVIVGAGINGMYQLRILRELGLRVKGVEASDDIGGTWHYNRYPGCRLDSESHTYGYLWSKDLMGFPFSERYISQPEVLRYLHHAEEKMDVRKDFLFNTRVRKATWDGENRLWTLEFDGFDKPAMTTRFWIAAVGALSAPTIPNYQGIHTFKGRMFHTARWPRQAGGFEGEKIDFAGKRVAVIGTGASGVQVIQTIAPEVKELVVFQRTPNWCMPLRNAPLGDDELEGIRANYDEIVAYLKTTVGGFAFSMIERNLAEEPEDVALGTLEKLHALPGFAFWLGGYQDVLSDKKANAIATEFMEKKIRARIADQTLADKLIPAHGFGLRRVPLETGYYETYNRDNVRLVSLLETAIERITQTGIRTTDEELEFDIIVMATGFDAILGATNRIEIIGKDGRSLKKEWEEKGVRTYLGVQSPGFPNLFMLSGPQTGNTFCNIPRCTSATIEWLGEMFTRIRDENLTCIEPRDQQVDWWSQECDTLFNQTLFAETDSWFTGINSNVEGRSTRSTLLYVGGYPAYQDLLRQASANRFEVFEMA